MRVTVYRIWPEPHSGGAYQFVLRSPCQRQTNSFHYEMTSIDVPEGYTLTRRGKQPVICDPLDQPCELCGDQTGECVVLDSDQYRISLPTETMPDPTRIWMLEEMDCRNSQ